MKIKQLKKQVLSVLREVPETRNSDITLMIEVWKRYYPHFLKETKDKQLGVYLKDLYELPREDNIKRIRAKIQNEENKYLPTSMKIAIKRHLNMNEWHKAMAFNQYETQ